MDTLINTTATNAKQQELLKMNTLPEAPRTNLQADLFIPHPDSHYILVVQCLYSRYPGLQAFVLHLLQLSSQTSTKSYQTSRYLSNWEEIMVHHSTAYSSEIMKSIWRSNTSGSLRTHLGQIELLNNS